MHKQRRSLIAFCFLAAACGGAGIGPATGQDLSADATVAMTVEVEGEGPLVVTRPKGCGAEPGSPTDLSAEPAHWLAFGTYLRWTDTDGCPVRIDVISHIRGAGHCNWQAAEFITIGNPLGASFASGLSPETTNRYVWDPTGVLPDGPYGDTLASAELPSSADDTGFRREGAALWLNADDESVLYRVRGEVVEIWLRDFEVGLCA